MASPDHTGSHRVYVVDGSRTPFLKAKGRYARLIELPSEYGKLEKLAS